MLHYYNFVNPVQKICTSRTFFFFLFLSNREKCCLFLIWRHWLWHSISQHRCKISHCSSWEQERQRNGVIFWSTWSFQSILKWFQKSAEVQMKQNFTTKIPWKRALKLLVTSCSLTELREGNEAVRWRTCLDSIQQACWRFSCSETVYEIFGWRSTVMVSETWQVEQPGALATLWLVAYHSLDFFYLHMQLESQNYRKIRLKGPLEVI